ncbi:MAG: hypothetical protein ABL955_04635 [Elusimicrobiota bacterium]
MKTRRLTTILTSAYLSAMLATSVAPLRSDATLAATIDPMAAQKALQIAVNGLNASGWTAAATLEAPPAAQATPVSIPANNPAPKADPIMTEELMARLIKYARGTQKPSTLDKKICKVLDLCDGTEDLTIMLLKGDLTDTNHYFAVPLDAKSKDVLIILKSDTALEAYLTDKIGTLRAAAIGDKTSVRLITNEKAAEKFKSEMTQFAKEASELPATGTAVAGNS